MVDFTANTEKLGAVKLQKEKTTPLMLWKNSPDVDAGTKSNVLLE